MKKISPRFYRTLESTMSIFSDNKQFEGVNALLQVYQKALNNYKELCSGDFKKHPFIVLEGLDGCGKSTTSKRLASKIGAQHWCTPPNSIKHFRHLFDGNVDLRTAYYALGNYIAALEVCVVLKTQPVVMDRYWHSTNAYAIAQAVHDFPETISMPPPGDKFYSWPEDLLKPDAVLFLNVTEGVRLQRISRRTGNTAQEDLLTKNEQFRNNIITAYKNMRDPSVTFIDGDPPGFTEVLRNIDSKIKHLFN